jgi:hypothetical protein
MIQVEKKYLDDIVCRMSKSQWDMNEALHWYELLKDRKVELPPIGMFFSQVHEHFDVFDAEMDAHFTDSQLRKRIDAKHDVCQNVTHTLVYLGTEEIDHELMELSSFYCPQCNSFWREP